MYFSRRDTLINFNNLNNYCCFRSGPGETVVRKERPGRPSQHDRREFRGRRAHERRQKRNPQITRSHRFLPERRTMATQLSEERQM